MTRYDAERTRAVAAVMFKEAARATQEAQAMREEAHDSRLRLWQEKLRTHRSMGGSRETGLQLALDAALSIAAASRGNIQVVARAGGLKVLTQRGFDAAFLNYFEYVNDARCACGVALARRRPVVVADVVGSPEFPMAETVQVLLDADVRSVVSIPLVRADAAFGMLSVHYHRPQACTDAELRRLSELADTIAALTE
jgi:GAF domain-containing protein